MLKKCKSPVKGWFSDLAIAANERLRSFNLQVGGALRAAGEIAWQIGIAVVTNIPAIKSGAVTEYAGRRQPEILYNIKPVVYHFQLCRLTGTRYKLQSNRLTVYY